MNEYSSFEDETSMVSRNVTHYPKEQRQQHQFKT